jgi:hypothetical protein
VLAVEGVSIFSHSKHYDGFCFLLNTGPHLIEIGSARHKIALLNGGSWQEHSFVTVAAQIPFYGHFYSAEVYRSPDFKIARFGAPAIFPNSDNSIGNIWISSANLRRTNWAYRNFSNGNEGSLGGLICCESVLEGAVGFFERVPLQTSNDRQGERNRGGDYQTRYSQIFSAVLLAFGFGLFCLISFKFVRQTIDGHGNIFLGFLGALAAVICAGLCLVYCLINLLDYEPQIGRQHALAPFDSRSENVIVKPTIIPELELGNVKWHVFGADLVERADDKRRSNPLLSVKALDCFAEPVIGRASARPVGSQ